MKFLFFIIALVFAVLVQGEITLKENVFPSQHLVSKVRDYKQQASNYLDFVQGLADNAKRELKENKNTRPSTEYSIHDIAFTVAKYLPSWVYPDTLWKEDTVTRRRHIAKVLRSSSLISRPRLVTIRDKVGSWTKRSGHNLAEEYFTNITLDLESLLNSIMDFVAATTDVELMNPLFMYAGYVTLDNSIEEYIMEADNKLISALDQVNQDFNHIVALSGELRIPLESMRQDAVTQTKYICNEMFKSSVANSLRLLGQHIKSELRKLSREISEIQDNQEASKAVREHTADSLRMEIQDLENIHTIFKKSRSNVERVWAKATNELVQSPIKINYWVDVVAEVKEVAIELLRLLLNSQKRYNQKHNHCSC